MPAPSKGWLTVGRVSTASGKVVYLPPPSPPRCAVIPGSVWAGSFCCTPLACHGLLSCVGKQQRWGGTGSSHQAGSRGWAGAEAPLQPLANPLGLG